MRKLLLIIALSAFTTVQVNAAVSGDLYTEPDYIINSGYSEAMAEEVLIAKNRINGKPAEPLYERKHGRFVRFCRNLYGYIDPAQDTDERIHHDVHMSPNAKDL